MSEQVKYVLEESKLLEAWTPHPISWSRCCSAL